MIIKTVSEITQDVLQKIGLVSGTAVQVYTEPQIQQNVRDSFDLLFRKRYWEHLSDWVFVDLDGVNGYATTDLTNIVKSLEDAKDFHVPFTEQKIVKPIKYEHMRISTGSNPLFYTSIKYGDPNFESRVYKFWPPSATGSVAFYARTHPGVLNPNSKVPMPADLITYSAAWLTLETDGMNPGNAAKMQSLFQVTYNDYLASLGDDVIGHRGGRNAHTVWPSGN
jgi:hypothetical protein